MDMASFGSFSGFDWKTAVREGQTVSEFRRLNILFGRNYSGKTTLSRVFRSFEVGRLPENYKDPNFKIAFSSHTLTQEDISSHSFDVRVYNTDFVSENLSFLVDSTEGEIKPFAIIGSENKKIEERIREIEKELGDADQKTGKKYELTQAREEYSGKKQKAKNAEAILEEKLRRQANVEIKHNKTYGNANYNINSIKKDIQTVRRESITVLQDSQVSEKKDLLKEEPLPDINIRVSFNPAFKTLCEGSAEILAAKIKPSESIQELLDDSLLQTWVRSGMDYHRNKRSVCGFCGQDIPEGLWEKLDAHFSREVSELEGKIKAQMQFLEFEIGSLSKIRLPEKESFYASVRSSFQDAEARFNKVLSSYRNESQRLLKELRARQSDIFSPRQQPDFKDFSKELGECIDELNEIIERNNGKTSSLSKDQEKARRELRLNAAAEFISEINLSLEEQKIAALKKDKNESRDILERLEARTGELEEEKGDLQKELQDERKGAEKVNEYLNHFFGLEGLKLNAQEDDMAESRYKFQIMRGSQPAYNMSEGERSLVSFCYFMAKLEDTETKGKDLIVYIDDPVSSLDSNHIFFVFSLIESALARPQKNPDGSNGDRYKQLFISTHNLDFLKYLKRLSAPDADHGGREFFLLEKGESSSSLKLMPKYLKDYQTEFIYLFHQIYKCKDEKALGQDSYEVFYNFGNNLRKFLESYLFYKYPYKETGRGNLEKRLRKFFGDDPTTTALVNRIINEFSHLEEILDRGAKPVDVAELSKTANFVLDTIRKKDEEQYDSLLRSIEESR